MADIFQAYQPSLGRYVAIKMLRQELRTHPEMIERFRREARALATILHQNVAHVYDFVESDSESYILMEYIDGIDLSTIIQKVGHLPPTLAAAILLGVARGVSYIHTHNLIHRDIKPSNIRLTTRGEVKLMDFGIVIFPENQALTRPGVMVGSPYYLSPEQVLGDVLTPKVDIFLLGICFYEMLTGIRPFRGEGAVETVFAEIRGVRYTPARTMQSLVPKSLERIIRKCLQKDPAKRYPSAKVLIDDLEKFLGPLQSHYTEDLMLKFLDEEALVNPAVKYAEIGESRKTGSLWSTVLVFLLAAVLSFFAGFEVGKDRPVHNFPPAKALR